MTPPAVPPGVLTPLPDPSSLTPAAALAALASETSRTGTPFLELFKHGTLSVEIYKPDRVDRQQPHTRDEIYVVIAGRGTFVIGPGGGHRHPFEPGQVLFVPAGVVHRFKISTPDFATGASFYGPEGGKRAHPPRLQ